MTPPARAPRHFAVMPAGGTGSRLGATIPKQYLELAGQPMIRRAAAALLAAPWIDTLLVVVAAGDERAAPALAGLPRTTLLGQGGATRRDTVLAGLRALRFAGAAGLPSGGATVELARLLGDPDEDVRSLALRLAGETLEPSLRPHLRKALGAGAILPGLMRVYLATEVLFRERRRASARWSGAWPPELPTATPDLVQEIVGDATLKTSVRALALHALAVPSAAQRPWLRALVEGLEYTKRYFRVG